MVFPRKCKAFWESVLFVYCVIMMLAVISLKTEVNVNNKLRESELQERFSDKNRDENKKLRTLQENVPSDSEKESFKENKIKEENGIKYSHDPNSPLAQFLVKPGDFGNFSVLPESFPLGGGLMRPVPYYRLGSAKKGSTLTIGIPSVKRSKKEYLFDSVQSLIDNLSVRDMDNVTIVVFLGDQHDESFIIGRFMRFMSRFPEEIKNGNLEVIAPPPSMYPNKWEGVIRPTFGDDLERTKWRSKQNLDQIFLMMYIYHLNPNFYLMMEDDIIAAKNYYKSIMKAVNERTRSKWFYISFCSLGAIGKLFRNKDLPHYASFIHSFWKVKPLDWIQTDFSKSKACSYDEDEMTCIKRLRMACPQIHPSLFQHVGKTSSLTGKIQNLTDTRFKPMG